MAVKKRYIGLFLAPCLLLFALIYLAPICIVVVTSFFNWKAGARYAELNYLIAREIADGAARPRWYEGDYFGNTFAPDAPKVARPASPRPASPRPASQGK